MISHYASAKTAWKNITSAHFKMGDRVRWNSEAGYVSGMIRKVHKSNFDWKGYTRHCSEDDPQYEIESDRTDHIAMHNGDALERMESG